MKKIIAPALALLLLAGSAPLVAHANNPVTPAPRFAVFTKIDGDNATGVLPLGFHNIVETPINDVFRVDAPTSTPPLYSGPFWERFLANNTRPSAFIIPRVTTSSSTRTTTVTFDGLMPANLVGVGILDVDTQENLWVKVLGPDGVAFTPEECGPKNLFNSIDGNSGQMQLESPPQTFPQGGVNDYCFRLFDSTAANTTGATFWFVPTRPFRRIVFTENAGREAIGIVIAADRPQPTITPKPSVPTNFTIGEDPITITPDMFEITWPEHVLSDQFTPDGDFDDTIGVQFRVKDDGGTGCTLESNSPLTFSATTPGTCIIECFQPERPNFLPATIDIPITVTTAQTPSPANTSRPATTPEAVPDASGPELAATGARGWPLWAGVAVMGSGVVVLWVLRRQNRVSA